MIPAARAAVIRSPRFTTRWIISRGVDSVFIIGSALAGYLYLLLYTALHVPIGPLWWIWSIGFDGTHIFAMASRTYFDREARARNRRLFFGSLLFFFSLGPLMVAAGWKGWLYLLVGAWAYYHVIRQHYGFLVLYKVKNRDLARIDNTLDRLFLGVMLLLPPVHRFLIHHPEELGIPWSFPGLERPMFALAALIGAVYLGRQGLRVRRGDPVHVPTFLLLAAVLPLHALTFAHMSWQAAVPTVTIVHNLQYHAIVWFHNRNRYAAGST